MTNYSTYVPGASPLTTKGDLLAFSTLDDRLPIGTNDFVLTAASSEDMGVKWAAPAAAGDVASDVIFDAKGDLAGGTGADTAVKLPVGSNDQVLTADSGETTGMKWADIPAPDPSNVFTSVSGTSYTILASDNGKEIIFINAAAIAVTVPDTLAIGFQCIITQTTPLGIPTCTRSGSETINGASAGVAPDDRWKGLHLTKYLSAAWIAKF